MDTPTSFPISSEIPNAPKRRRTSQYFAIKDKVVKKLFSHPLMTILETNEDCCICYDKSQDSFYKLECNHFFHKSCIDKWFKKNMSCPMCRNVVS